MLDYTATLSAPVRHELDLTLSFEPDAPTTTVHVAAWTPGSYLIREYTRFIGPVTATNERGEPCAVRQVAKGSWDVDTSDAERVTIAWTGHGQELTVRTPHIDGTHAFFTGTNLLLFVDGRTDEACRLTVDAPGGWTVFCPLDADDDGAWLADDWDTLADTPIEIGPHLEHRFEVMGVPHRFVFWGADMVDIDLRRLENDVRAIVEQNARCFDGDLPYPRYDFVFHITATGRGGLEHLNSTVLATPWAYFDTDEGWLDMLGLISHEHYHTWNVKRIRPAALTEFDYLNENHTTGLWVCEGVTSYMDDLNCARAGVFTRSEWLKRLGTSMTRYTNTPGRFVETVASASFNAWTRLYRPDANTPFRSISYYLKGALVTTSLDLLIRDRTDGESSFDDVMRLLWQRWEATGEGFDEYAFDAVIRDATGVDVRDELDRIVFGTEDPPLKALLLTHGVELGCETPDGADTGIEFASGSTEVKHVRPGSAAERAGVCPGDVVVAFDRRRVTASNLSKRLERLRPGRTCTMHVFRRDELLGIEVAPETGGEETWTATVAETLTDRQRTLLDAWLPQDPAPTDESDDA